MEISKVVVALKAERDRLDQAISALEGGRSSASKRGRPAKAAYAGKRRKMSSAARAKIAAAKKAWWAKQKRAAASRRKV